jgi:hypothetical protein
MDQISIISSKDTMIVGLSENHDHSSLPPLLPWASDLHAWMSAVITEMDIHDD